MIQYRRFSKLISDYEDRKSKQWRHQSAGNRTAGQVRKTMELLHMITKATPLDGLKVRVEFDGGEVVGIYDCAPLTKDPYWSCLTRSDFFKTARAEYGTLVWNNNIDVAPESVWEDSVKEVRP